MRVLVAGGTGAIGRRLVPLLADHDVTVLSRSGRPVERAKAVQADALDPEQVRRAADGMDVVVNLLTAIPDPVDARRMASQFALTNRLRVEGTRNLLAAAPSRLVSESTAFSYHPDEGLADEDAPLWSSPPAPFAPVLDAIKALEDQTREAGGTVLRVGHLHGDGTTFGPGGGLRTLVQAGRLPVVGGGTAVFSFAHVDDVAAAFAAAVTGPAGTYNIADDEPVPVSTWLPAYAQSLGARPPRGVPAPVARLAVGGWGVAFLTRLRGADNARAKTALGWAPTRTWSTSLAL